MKKALVVGINGYGTSPLSGCINDAASFGNLIETNEDGAANFSVKIITDDKEKVTKGGLKKAISELFSGANDTALLFFSGHGFSNEFGGCIVTPDYSSYDEGISMDDILKVANKSKARNKIVIFDCCHSGIFGEIDDVSGKSIISEGMTILTACRSDESAVEINGHGIFTSLLLEGLSGGAADVLGKITPGSLYSYIDKALGPWEQRPIFKTNISRFTSIRDVQPRVNISVLRNISNYFPAADYEFQLDPSYEDTQTCSKPENIKIFKELQKLQSIGLIIPVDEEFMYYAAMNSKKCRLTAVGHLYWKLAKEKKI